MEMSNWISSGGHAPHRARDAFTCNSRPRPAARWKPPLQMTGAALLIALTAPPAPARDRGQFAGTSPEMKAWFDGLRSGKGPCCSDADGSAVSDVDWETRNGHYRVRIDGAWIDVPDEAVITEPNRVGRTMVWPLRGYLGVSIRCFMPGSMT
jgi:hypothetical protein